MRLAILCALALACSSCAMVKRAVVHVPMVDCGPTQYRYCEAPKSTAGNTLEATEPEDSENRAIAQACAADHRVLVDCLRGLGKGETIRTAETPK